MRQRLDWDGEKLSFGTYYSIKIPNGILAEIRLRVNAVSNSVRIELANKLSSVDFGLLVSFFFFFLHRGSGFMPIRPSTTLVSLVGTMTRISVYQVAILLFAFYGCPSGFAEDVEGIGIEMTTIDGCAPCGYNRCPEDTTNCLFGRVMDSCECCPNGVCGKLEGEACWNATTGQIASKTRYDGFCASNYNCEVRPDLPPTADVEAVCVCREQSSVCGNNNKTYATPCAIHEEAFKQNNSSLKLWHLGPCLSPPEVFKLSSPTMSFSASYPPPTLGCRAKGIPVPDVHWEFHSVNGVIKFPSMTGPMASVETRDGPEIHMLTSLLHLFEINEEHGREYVCVGKNPIGRASVSFFLYSESTEFGQTFEYE